jgi:hypothetical protein
MPSLIHCLGQMNDWAEKCQLSASWPQSERVALALSRLAVIVPRPLSLVVSQFEFQLCVGANGSYQASGPLDIRRQC